MKRKAVVVLLCGILAVSSLAGCGNTQVEEAEPVSTEEPSVEEEPPVAEEEAPAVEEVVEEVTEEVEEEEPEPIVEEKYICLAERYYDADGDWLTKYIYNEHGDVLGTGCDVDGNLTGSTSYEYEYDADGNKIKEIETNAAFSITSEYEYDANGNVTKFTLNNSDVEGFYTDEYEYDANGNMIKDIWTDFDADGNEESSSFHEYEYDASGNIIKEISDIGPGTFVYEYENEYDENGNIIKYTCNHADEDGEVFSTDLCEYKYDDENRLLSETIYDWSGVIYHEYDEHGNNTRHIQYSTDDFFPSFCAEYKYMELQEYLAAKESIDAEEIEIETVIANGESIESILSGLGISLNNN